MSDGLNVLITGANRGIGKGLVASYLAQNGSTVIATVRDFSNKGSRSLDSLPKGTGSSLILVNMEMSSEKSIADAVENLKTEHNVSKIDVIISNAAIGTTVGTLATVDISVIQKHIDVNAYGPLHLFRHALPLLQAAEKPKFIAISSPMASIAALEVTGKIPLSAYGSSKTLLNAFIKRLAVEHEDVIVFALNPGTVDTETARATTAALGYTGFNPISVDECASGITKIVTRATKENSSGHFFMYTGDEMPW